MSPGDAAAIISVLNRHGVRYVVIGAFAAIAQQAPIDPTRDIDVTPEHTTENLQHLSDALKELGARIRTDAVDGGLPFDHDGASLGRGATWNLVCALGEFDISFRPAGFDKGYPQLAKRAHRMEVAGVEVIASAIAEEISRPVQYRPLDPAAVGRVASRIADLI